MERKALDSKEPGSRDSCSSFRDSESLGFALEARKKAMKVMKLESQMNPNPFMESDAGSNRQSKIRRISSNSPNSVKSHDQKKQRNLSIDQERDDLIFRSDHKK